MAAGRRSPVPGAQTPPSPWKCTRSTSAPTRSVRTESITTSISERQLGSRSAGSARLIRSERSGPPENNSNFSRWTRRRKKFQSKEAEAWGGSCPGGSLRLHSSAPHPSIYVLELKDGEKLPPEAGTGAPIAP